MEIEQLSKAVRARTIEPTIWQQRIQELLADIELADILTAIDYDTLAMNAVYPESNESTQIIDFSKTEGLSTELSFVPFFLAMKKGVAIAPHGHRNMTSMHMILDGKVHTRHYDRIADEPGHITIKPTMDEILVRSAVTTISDQKDNIHWFRALSDRVFMFNIAVFGIKPGEGFAGREFIDPKMGEKQRGGLMRAKRLKEVEARKLYGRS